MLPLSSLEPVQPPARPTVLCIDDGPLVLHFYRGFPKSRGCRVLTTTDGLRGIALAHRDRADVIVLNVMLRGRSGFGLCRKLRADRPLRDIPIILLTALDNACLPGTGQKAGATRTLRKPADAGTLLTPIAQMLREWKGPPQGDAGPRWEHKELARALKITVKELAD